MTPVEEDDGGVTSCRMQQLEGVSAAWSHPADEDCSMHFDQMPLQLER
jgi:hypothetical protein